MRSRFSSRVMGPQPARIEPDNRARKENATRNSTNFVLSWLGKRLIGLGAKLSKISFAQFSAAVGYNQTDDKLSKVKSLDAILG